MHIETRLLKGVYTDSMSLMALSTEINKLPGVKRAMIGMGTDMNKQVIQDVGLMTPEINAATTGDMMFAVEAETEEAALFALDEAERQRTMAVEEQASEASFSSLDQAMQDDSSDLVVISVPGEYAAGEAKKALEQNKNVMIFSDNVSVEDELSLKQYAHDKGLLVMGPDCGTAIINSVGLCFANNVNDGSVGVVAASGTGAQEVSVQVDILGGGISQLIGVGGRDLSEEIGGIMMLDGMNMLDQDDDTKVIILLSKPPAHSVAEKVLAAAKQLSKPVVVCFIGEPNQPSEANLVFTNTTIEAAKEAVKLAGIELPADSARSFNVDGEFSDSQKYVRGVFCGGTICDEVFYRLKSGLSDMHSNVAGGPDERLPVGAPSRYNTVIDMGSDEFTSGRPHPMIDPSFRNERLIVEASDPGTAVILLDFVLGYGSHDDPVGAAKDSIVEAFRIAKDAGRHIEIIAYVLGTDKDSQGKSEQIAMLEGLGVKVVNTVVELGDAALSMVNK